MAKKREAVPLTRGASSFHLLGKAKIGQNTFAIDNESQSSDWIYSSMSLGVDTGNGNVVYANMMAGYGAERENVIYVHGKDSDGKDDWKNTFTVDWEDRFNEDLLDTIADTSFITVGVEKDVKGKTVYKKFLSAYDAVEYLNENLADGMIVNVKGNKENIGKIVNVKITDIKTWSMNGQIVEK